MYANSFQQPFGYPQQPGVYGAAPMYPNYGMQSQPAQPVMNNFLTPDQMAEIQLNPQLFPTKLTRDEYMRSICTHKKDNQIKLEKLGDGQHHCTICAADFYLFDLNTPEDNIINICKNMHDLLQSIKTYLLNAPEALKDIYMMLGFIQKTPLLWKSAVKTFEQASNTTAIGLQQEQGNPNAFQVLNGVFGGGVIPGSGFGGGGYYGQPTVPPMAVYSQPGFGAQPIAPLPQAPVPMTGQPQVYGQAPGYGFNPNQVVQQTPMPAPGVPANGYAAPPPGYPNPSANPIGYVDPSAGGQPMATATVQVGSQIPQMPIQQPVVAPPPPPPTNPNLQTSPVTGPADKK